MRTNTSQRFTGVGLSLLAAVEILAGFGVQTSVVGVVGANRMSDGYFGGLSLPQFFLAVGVAPLVSVLIPLLAAGRAEDHRRNASAALALGVGGACIVTLVLVPTADLWIRWVFPGFAPQDRPLLRYLTQVHLLSLAPAVGCAVLKASSYARRRFLSAELTSVTGAVLGLGVLLVTLPRFGVQAAVWVNLARYVATFVALAALEWPRAVTSVVSEFTGRLWQRARPLVLGSLVYKTEPIIDLFLSSLARPGDLALFAFCRTLLGSGLLVLNQALIAPIIPGLAVQAEQRAYGDLRRKIHQRMALMGAVAALGVLLFAVVGHALLAVLVGMMTGPSTFKVADLYLILLCLAGMPIGSGVGQIVTSAYYAMGETRLLTQLGLAAFALGVVLKIAGFWLDGLRGLALATSLYYMVDFLMQWIGLERRLRRLAASS
jgi:putative peptidoglycan lipid II flippase